MGIWEFQKQLLNIFDAISKVEITNNHGIVQNKRKLTLQQYQQQNQTMSQEQTPPCMTKYIAEVPVQKCTESDNGYNGYNGYDGDDNKYVKD